MSLNYKKQLPQYDRNRLISNSNIVNLYKIKKFDRLNTKENRTVIFLIGVVGTLRSANRNAVLKCI